MTSVLLVQAVAKHYRVPFFDGLHAALASRGIRLRVAYGSPPRDEQTKADHVMLDPAYGVHVPGRWLLGDRLCYQPILPLARGVELVIVEHANKQLVNLPLYVRTRLSNSKLAFWGQGKNGLCRGDSLGERVKGRTLCLADWWFAYTRGGARYVTSRGVPPDIVTVVQNAIDTRQFRDELVKVSVTELAEARARFGMASDDPVGLFCGSLYAGKKIEFLIDAARLIRDQVPGFHLLVVGAGPSSQELAARAAGMGWIHFLGRQSGAARAIYFRMAHVFLIPAFVGLAIVDAFAAGLPVLTTELRYGHGAEFEYVEHGRNGLVVPHDRGAYANAVAGLVRDPALLSRLSAGARAAGDVYTNEEMVENFTAGVLRCLHRMRS